MHHGPRSVPGLDPQAGSKQGSLRHRMELALPSEPKGSPLKDLGKDLMRPDVDIRKAALEKRRTGVAATLAQQHLDSELCQATLLGGSQGRYFTSNSFMGLGDVVVVLPHSCGASVLKKSF